MRADVVLMLLLTALAAVALPIWGWWRTWRRLEALRHSIDPQLTVDERLEQFERTLEALATTQERLVENQDFLTRVVAERLPVPEMPQRRIEPKVSTPH